MTLSTLEENVPQFMTIDTCARELQVSPRTIRRYINQKKNPLPAVYFSDHTLRIPWDQFEVWVKSIQKGGEQ